MRRLFVNKHLLALFLVCLSISALTGFELANVLATPAPTVNTTVTPGNEGACTWFVSLDGTTPLARALIGGLSVNVGDNVVGTAGQDFGAFLTPLTTAKTDFCFGPGVFPFTSTWTLNQVTRIQGMGSGQLWNDAEPAITEFKWTGSSNNIPLIKISNGVLSEGILFRDIKLFYAGTSTGTDGIYIDGATSVARHIIFDAVNVQDFTGYCLRSFKTVFDIYYYNFGAMSCTLGGVIVDPGSNGVPTQQFFYGPTIIENVANKWAMNMTACSQCAIFGGTIANGLSGGNGLFVKGLNSFGVMNVNFEGANNAFGTGLQYYSGTGLTIEGGGGIIQTWAIGLEIGPDPSGSASATYWYVNGNWATNAVDIKITAGGSRNGIIGPVGTSFTTLTNNRATGDGVYADLLEQFMPNSASYPAPASVTPGASPWSYTNLLFYNQLVNINGGTVSSVTVGGITICSATPCAVFLPPGKIVITTYSVVPTSVARSYAGP